MSLGDLTPREELELRRLRKEQALGDQLSVAREMYTGDQWSSQVRKCRVTAVPFGAKNGTVRCDCGHVFEFAHTDDFYAQIKAHGI